MADVDRVADFETVERNLDVVGDQGCIADEFQIMTDNVEHSTALHAGRSFMVDEVNRDVHMHFGMFTDAQEVRVKRAFADGMERHILAKRANLLATNFDHDDRVHEVAGVQCLQQQLFFDVNRLGCFVIAVYDGGDAALITQCTRGSLAFPFAFRPTASADRSYEFSG